MVYRSYKQFKESILRECDTPQVIQQPIQVTLNFSDMLAKFSNYLFTKFPEKNLGGWSVEQIDENKAILKLSTISFDVNGFEIPAGNVNKEWEVTPVNDDRGYRKLKITPIGVEYGNLVSFFDSGEMDKDSLTWIDEMFSQTISTTTQQIQNLENN